MTDEEWWDEFGECLCDECACSPEVRQIREVLSKRFGGHSVVIESRDMGGPPCVQKETLP